MAYSTKIVNLNYFFKNPVTFSVFHLLSLTEREILPFPVMKEVITMKKVISMLMCFLLFFSFSVTASAKAIPGGTAQPYYEKAREAKSELTINGTTATCESTVRGNPDVVKIVAVQTLEKQGNRQTWDTYNGTTWTKTAYSNSLTVSHTKPGLEGGKYRLKTVFTLTDEDGGTETITVYSSEEDVP